MFPKQFRFPSRIGEDFFANARRIYSPLFVAYYKKRTDELVRAGVVVPKKHAPKATKRNEIKRQVREQMLPYLKKIQGIEVVFYLKTPLNEKNKQEMGKEIAYLFKKLKKQ